MGATTDSLMLSAFPSTVAIRVVVPTVTPATRTVSPESAVGSTIVAEPTGIVLQAIGRRTDAPSDAVARTHTLIESSRSTGVVHSESSSILLATLLVMSNTGGVRSDTLSHVAFTNCAGDPGTGMAIAVTVAT